MIPDNFYLMGPTSSSSSPPSQSHQEHPQPVLSSSSSYSSSWTRFQDKQFETALVTFPEGTPNRWEQIASRVPGKTPLEIERHYQILLDDINAIEAGLVELPNYTDDLIDSGEPIKPKGPETERRKGTPWTEEEHKLFLIGLQRYGKGDWRSISRNAVVSRTPTQVASHAQKYFNRINSDKKEKKRSSIHDITVDEATIRQVSNMPVTDSSQSQTDTLSSSQVSFSNQGSNTTTSGGYPSYGM